MLPKRNPLRQSDQQPAQSAKSQNRSHGSGREPEKIFSHLPGRGISRKVADVKAVDNISFHLQRGNLGVVGESGCGKSTTGRTILHLEKPTAGKVYLGGYRPDPAELERNAAIEAQDADDLSGFLCIAQPAPPCG